MQTRNPSRLLYIRKKPERGANKQREKSIQRALMTTLRTEFPFVVDFYNDWAAGAYLTHGQSSQRRALSSGKGWSDLFIPYPVTHVLPSGIEKTYHGCFIEIKKENTRIYRRDGGIVADEQVRIEEAFLKRMNSLGYFARFGIGMEGCERILRWYLNPDYKATDKVELF